MPSAVEIIDDSKASSVTVQDGVELVEVYQAVTQVTALDTVTSVEAYETAPTVVEAQATHVEFVEVNIGIKGDPGDSFQNLFVGQTDPGLTIPGLWIETNPDDSVKTFWVNV